MSSHSLQLLIVEDDPQLQTLLRMAAERTAKFDPVFMAADGQEAWDFLQDAKGQASHALPDFVLSDLSMPRMDGVQLIRAMKADPKTSGIPVAVTTSSDLPNDLEEATAAGCCAFFQKPVRLEEMVTLIGSLPNICGQDAVVSGSR